MPCSTSRVVASPAHVSGAWTHRLLAWLLLPLLLCGLAGAVRATEQPITARPLAPGEHIALDGSLSHPAWARAPLFDRFIEKAPGTGTPARQKTQVRVLYDDAALYFGIRAFDDDPAAIRAPLVRHDGVNRTQDFVGVVIDAVGQRQSGQFFRVNAAGSTADGMYTAADDSEDFAPDFDFDAATQRDDQGWTAVLRIPFASLRFEQLDRPAWRVMFFRRTPRAQFMLDLSVALPRDAPSFIAALQPLAGLRLPEHATFLTLRPSLTLRGERQSADGQPDMRRQQWDASLDLKWRPRPELVVDAALNPDFSQVALDVPQLAGNTRYALSLAEKRPFFAESSDLLRSPTQALYTRSFTQPRAGLRATWRGQGLAGTAFAVDDKGGGQVLLPGPWGTGAAAQPGSRALVARLWLDQSSAAADDAVAASAPGTPLQWGALWVDRRYAQGRGSNQVGGPDLAWQVTDAWRLRAQWLASSTSAQPGADGALVRGAPRSGRQALVKAFYQTPTREAEIVWSDASSGFRHDTGFVNQTGVRSLSLRLGHGWQALGPFNDFWFNLEAKQVRAVDSGLTVTRDVYPGIWLTGADNLDAWLQWHGQALQRSAPQLPLLAQRFVSGGLVFTPARWLPLLSAEARVGRLTDVAAGRVRPGANVSLTLTTRPLRWLELEPSIWRAWLRSDAVGGAARRVYDESALQWLAVAHLDARQSLRLIVQRTSVARQAEPGVDALRQSSSVASFTYAWRRSSGSALYVGVSRQRGEDASLPPATRQRGSEAFIKLQLDWDARKTFSL